MLPSGDSEQNELSVTLHSVETLVVTPFTAALRRTAAYDALSMRTYLHSYSYRLCLSACTLFVRAEVYMYLPRCTSSCLGVHENHTASLVPLLSRALLQALDLEVHSLEKLRHSTSISTSDQVQILQDGTSTTDHRRAFSAELGPGVGSTAEVSFTPDKPVSRVSVQRKGPGQGVCALGFCIGAQNVDVLYLQQRTLHVHATCM